MGYGTYYPHQWSHIDTDAAIFLQGFIMARLSDAGDNIYRIYKNGVSCINQVAAAVQVPAANIMGLVFVPGTDRLNNH